MLGSRCCQRSCTVSAATHRRECAAAPAAAVMRQRARRRSRPAAHRTSPVRRSTQDRGQRSCDHASACPSQLHVGGGASHCPARHSLELAQAALQAHLETKVETQESASSAAARDHRPHTNDGDGQSLGSRANPWRAPLARNQGEQADHPEVHTPGPKTKRAIKAVMVEFSRDPHRRYLGL